MAEATHHAWSDVRLEQLTPLLSRKVLTGDRAMVAQVFLKKGSIVKAHEHHNEQVTYILEGALRFWLGENADKAPNAPYVDVRAGEVLLIPGNVRHEAHAARKAVGHKRAHFAAAVEEAAAIASASLR